MFRLHLKIIHKKHIEPGIIDSIIKSTNYIHTCTVKKYRPHKNDMQDMNILL